MTRRCLKLLLVLIISACASPRNAPVQEPAAVLKEPDAESSGAPMDARLPDACKPGDDGIGGTGCKTD